QNLARVTRRVVIDHDPPSAPVLSSVLAGAAPDVLVATWGPSPSPDVIGYLLFRNGLLANAPGVVLGDLRPYVVPAPSYQDRTLSARRHCYRLAAMDEAGNQSAPSNEICQTLDNRAPHADIVEPANGLRFQFPIEIVAFTPDTDVASVRFQIKPEAQS